VKTLRIQYAIVPLILISAAGQIACAQESKKPLADRLAAEDTQQLAKDARTQGDAQRGAIAFHQRRLSCTRCHTVGEGKSLLGPDLASLGKEVTDVHLVESVLTPSKEIAKNYDSVIVITTKGSSIVGLLVQSDDKGVVLRDPASGGKTVFVPRANVDEEIKSKTSVMPLGLASCGSHCCTGSTKSASRAWPSTVGHP
jgi:putative heme-binding domain-containing protein